MLMRRGFFSSRATKTGAIDTTFGSNGIPTCRWLHDICGVGDRLKNGPSLCKYYLDSHFLPGQGGTKWATFGTETGQKGVLVDLITH